MIVTVHAKRLFLPLLLCLLLASCDGGGAKVDTPGSGTGGSGTATQTEAGAFPTITLTRIATGFTRPLHITHAGDGSARLFISEKGGVVKIIRNGAVLPSPFADFTAVVRSTGSEQGLLSIAFPPNFAVRRHFYADYTATTGIGDTVVARIPANPASDVADTAGASEVLRVPQPFENHNGGQLAFGPDGFLYIGMGDGGGEGDPLNNAQNRSVLLGKILRVDVESPVATTYAVPAGNPFGSEIWSYGLRNPWRFSFDRTNGDLFIADVGGALFEEVNVQPSARGADNYGWNIMEGFHCLNSPTCNQTGLTLPVAEYGHDNGNCSITGGFVYRGTRFPSLQGIYIYGDFCSGRIWGLRNNGTGWDNRLLLESGLSISTFGEDEEGNMYLADFGAGDIYRIDVQ